MIEPEHYAVTPEALATIAFEGLPEGKEVIVTDDDMIVVDAGMGAIHGQGLEGILLTSGGPDGLTVVKLEPRRKVYSKSITHEPNPDHLRKDVAMRIQPLADHNIKDSSNKAGRKVAAASSRV